MSLILCLIITPPSLPFFPQHALVKMDLTNCAELAYSEIRAAREAECHYTSQLCSWFKKQCVKSTATRSTATLFPEEGAKCVMGVFEAAFKDMGPEQLHAGLTTGGGAGGDKGGGARGGREGRREGRGGEGGGEREGGKAPIGRTPTAASMRVLIDNLQTTGPPSAPSSSSFSAFSGVSGMGLAETLATAFGIR